MIREPLSTREVAKKLAVMVQGNASGATHVLVGPVLFWGDYLNVLVAAGRADGPGWLIGLDASRQPNDGVDRVVPASYLNLWVMQRRDRLQKRQDAAMRWAFVIELERLFARVQTYDNDLALAEAYYELFGQRALWPARAAK